MRSGRASSAAALAVPATLLFGACSADQTAALAPFRTGGWATYGVDWQPDDWVRFYYDACYVGQEHLSANAPEFLVLDLTQTPASNANVEPAYATWAYARVWATAAH